jgi:hypothetical protein
MYRKIDTLWQQRVLSNGVMKHYSSPSRHRRNSTRRAAALMLALAAIVGTVAYQTALSSAPSLGALLNRSEGNPAADFVGYLRRTPPAPPVSFPGEGEALLSEADGLLPGGVSIFDERYAGVTYLSSDLLRALRIAATDAAGDGIDFTVNSGWRSAAYQDELLQEAVIQYGSEAEAARWVATVATSPHVSGDAADIGPPEAAAWLSMYGADYGLCQIYANEPWHFELRPDAIKYGCPPLYADPTEDPRMQ